MKRLNGAKIHSIANRNSLFCVLFPGVNHVLLIEHYMKNNENF